MEFWKKKRTPLRAAFTKTANDLDAELLKGDNINEVTVELLLRRLENKFEKIKEADGEIMDKLEEEDSTQEMINAEIELTDTYNDRFSDLTTSAKRYFAKVRKAGEEEDFQSVASSSHRGSPSSKRKFKLPKIEWKKFNGEPKEWLGFWGQFSKIDKDEEMDLADKFQYLLQAVEKGSRAAELVESFPPSGKCYPKAIESLKDRFGNEEILVEVYVRELLRLVLQNALNPKTKIVLASLYDKLETQLRALESLGVTSEKYASMLYPLVESCLPEDVLRAWERSRNRQVETETGENENRSQLTLLMAFLRGEVKGEERIQMARQGFAIEKEKKTKLKLESTEDVPTAAGLFSGQGKKTRYCIFCDLSSHDSPYCNSGKTKKLTLSEKRKIITKHGCCFVCFGTNHLAKSCEKDVQCPKCNRKHYKIMCPELETRTTEKAEKEVSKPVTEKKEASLVNQTCMPDVLLQTLLVRVIGGGKEKIVRAIIDNGSQTTYISKNVVRYLKFESIGEQKIVHCLFGGSESAPKTHQEYEIRVCSLDRSYYCRFKALDQEVICGVIPRVSKGSWISELKAENIKLTDLGSTSKSIELLIGSDISGKLYTGKRHELSNGLVAAETHLGWTVSGKLLLNSSSKSNVLLSHSLLATGSSVSDLWKLDTLGILDPAEKLSQLETQKCAKEHFLQTVQTDQSGRYEISLPWIEGHPPLQDNRDLAEKRLVSMSKKLTQENRNLYQSVFDNWTEEGIIEEVPCSEKFRFGHYLPHRPVFNEASKTTPVRPVFDASAKVKSSVSLNDCLEKGPNLLELIPAVLTRFRMEKVGVIADIKKAFLQIGVAPQDRDFLRFLWWSKEKEDMMTVYRHRRVVFGVSSSPFLLGATLNYIMEKVPQHLQNTAIKLKSSLYVDNCVTSLGSEDQARKFVQESVDILSPAKFDLRGWIIRTDSRENLGEAPVLGLNWNLEEDTLSCDFSRFKGNSEDKVTKRSILSAAHRIFDPIGFTTPLLLFPKLLLQEIWELKVGWDTELPKDIEKKFLIWMKQLPAIKNLKIPRWFGGASAHKENWTIHTFCDASMSAFATAVFLRIETEDSVKIHLVQAKARVSPITTSKKKITIPRLELLACLIGVRLAKSVKEDLGLEDVSTYFWTDSMNALFWIKTEDSWGTFVWNRVSEIRSQSKIEKWNHVPGIMNPADLPSRGCSADRLVESKWWEGPNWLKDKNMWPKKKEIQPDESVISLEKKKTVVSALGTTRKIINTEWISNMADDYNKMLRIMAIVLRFANNLRNRKKAETCTIGKIFLQELQDAEMVILKLVQEESLGKDEIKNLLVEKDEKGILRMRTKILERKDAENFRLPILLPSNHIIVSMLVIAKHNELCHAGVQTLMSSLRERFWILKSRQSIRKIIFNCMRCKRFRVKPLVTEPIHLPKERVEDAAAFQVVGVDLAGPLFLKGNQKAWIFLFTCAVYRAVHLELVCSLSTEAFLQALRRFAARRGRPSVIYSDNGTNFVGAQNLLKNLDWTKIEWSVKTQRIEWRLIPPSAPWYGGWWERLIGVVKALLRKVLGKACLQYEELSTILCDVESVVNARPLTYVSEDPEDLAPLTPQMFLQGNKDSRLTDVDEIDAEGLNKRAKYLQKLREDLRKRFRTEYLGQLIHRGSAKEESPAVQVGDIVLIGDEKTKRLDWPLGRIAEVVGGRGKSSRVVRVKTARGILTRAVQRLYPLEVQQDDSTTLIKNPDERAVEIKGAEKIVVTRSGREVKKPERFVP